MLKYIKMDNLQETPDKIDIYHKPPEPEDGHYRWDSPCAIAIIADEELTDVFAGEWSHVDMLEDIFDTDIDELEGQDNWVLRKRAFHGRLWTEPKVISFWKQPTPQQLIKIINMLKNKYDFMDNIDIINDYQIELEYNPYQDMSTCQPVSDYIKGQEIEQDNNFDKNTLHLKNGEEKRKDPQMQGYLQDRSKNQSEKLSTNNNSREVTPAEYNFYKRYGMGENKNHINEEEFINGSVKLHNNDAIDRIKFCRFYDEENETFVRFSAWDVDGNVIYDDVTVTEEEFQNNIDENIVNITLSREFYYGGEIKDIKAHTPQNNTDPTEIENILKQVFAVDEYSRGASGYVLLDGSFITIGFVQHNDIHKYVYGIYSEDLMDLGFIRISSRYADKPCIEMFVEPTIKQKNTLYKIIGQSSAITVAVSGNGKQSIGYSSEPNPKIIINQIFRFYNEGINLQLENKKSKNSNKTINIVENVINDVKSDEINLVSFKPKRELNPKFWINGKLNSRVRLRLLDIADDFINELSINWVRPKDIVFTGSLANYNWSKYSDIDIHILIDYNDVYDKHDFVEDYFKTKKDVWADEHPNLKIYGYPVELYVEDINSKGVSSGVYSLEKNEWIAEPGDIQDAKLNEKYIKKIAARLMTAIDEIGDKLKNETDEYKIEKYRNKLRNIFDKLKNLRKEGLKDEGEMSSGNIIFKIIRRTNYFDKLWDMMNSSYDKLNSIKESKKRTIVITEEQGNFLKGNKGL